MSQEGHVLVLHAMRRVRPVLVHHCVRHLEAHAQIVIDVLPREAVLPDTQLPFALHGDRRRRGVVDLLIIWTQVHFIFLVLTELLNMLRLYPNPGKYTIWLRAFQLCYISTIDKDHN